MKQIVTSFNPHHTRQISSIHLKNNWIEANQFNSNKHFTHTWLSYGGSSCTCFLMLYKCIKNTYIWIPFQHIIHHSIRFDKFFSLPPDCCYISFFSHLLCMKIFAFIIFGIQYECVCVSKWWMKKTCICFLLYLYVWSMWDGGRNTVGILLLTKVGSALVNF